MTAVYHILSVLSLFFDGILPKSPEKSEIPGSLWYNRFAYGSPVQIIFPMLCRLRAKNTLNRRGESSMEDSKKKETALQALKFLLFSVSAGIIQVAVFTLLHEVVFGQTSDSTTGLTYWVPYLTALILSVIWNFTLNRRYTFRSAANVPIAMAKVFGYYCIFTPLSTIIGNYFSQQLHVNDYVVLGVTMVLNFVTEYLFCKFVVYRGQENTREDVPKKKA